MEAKEKRSGKPRRSDRRVKSSMSLDAAAALKPDAARPHWQCFSQGQAWVSYFCSFWHWFSKIFAWKSHTLGNFVKMCLRHKIMMDNSYSSEQLWPCPLPDKPSAPISFLKVFDFWSSFCFHQWLQLACSGKTEASDLWLAAAYDHRPTWNGQPTCWQA